MEKYKKLVHELSDLLIDFEEEPYSEKITLTEEAFLGGVVALSNSPMPYNYLADQYTKMYEYIKNLKELSSKNARNS